MSRYRLHSLHWASGGVCAFLGALALIGPHQYEYLGGFVSRSDLLPLGLLFILSGLALMALSVARPPEWFLVLADLLAGVLLAALSAAIYRTGSWFAFAQIFLLALGLFFIALVCLLSRYFPFPGQFWLQDPVYSTRALDDWYPEIFSLLIGLIALISATGRLLLMRTLPPPPFFQPNYAVGSLLLVMLSLAGAALAGSQLWAARNKVPVSGPNAPRLLQAVTRASHVLVGGLYLLILFFVAPPNFFWFAASFTGGLGLLTLLLPWIGPRLQWVNHASLYSRLAFIFGIAAGLPLVLAVALIGEREEQAMRVHVQAGQESQAVALAQGIAVDLRLHRSALQALSGFQSLLDLPPARQSSLLQSIAMAYPDLSAISLYDADGRPLASAGPAPQPGSIAGLDLYTAARSSLSLAVEILQPPLRPEPVFALSAPILNGGRFSGLVLFELPTAKVADNLGEEITPPGGRIYLLDSAGALISRSNGPPGDPLAAVEGDDGLLSSALLADILDAGAGHGSLTYPSASGEMLAAYARIPEPGWTVILEQPSRLALASLTPSKDLAFGVLLISLLATTAGSLFLARRLIRPLVELREAASRLAAGDDTAPLPRSTFNEFARLSAAFGVMRASLARRTRERQQALEAARASEALLRQMLDTMPVGVWFTDPSGAIIGGNAAMQQIWAGAPGSTAASGEYRAWIRASGEPVQPDRWAAQDGAGPRHAELEIECFDGSRKVILYSSVPIHSEQGGFTGAIIVHQNITPRVEAEQALQAAYEKLEQANRELSLINAELEETNRELESRVAERTAAYQEANRLLESLNAELQAANDELARAKLDLEWDLAERERINDRLSETLSTLEERERQLRTLLENLPVGVWLADARGRIAYANPAAHQLWIGTGTLDLSQPGALRGLSLETGQPLDLQEGVIPHVLQSGEARLRESLEIETPDGSRRIILNSAVPILDEAGKTLGVVMVNEDVTEQRRAEEALRSYAARLERSNQDLEHFAFIASHDLQEPLRKVRSFGELLKADFSPILGDRGRDYIFRMQDAAGRMQSMISDLLAYSRVSTQASPFQPVNLCEISTGVVSDLEALIERTGGSVELEPLPSLEADPGQMRQLLLNLIGNALKFHRKDVPPRVRVYSREAADRPGWVELLVEDNGIGFDISNLERILQPFQRLHGRSEYEGSGIGLAICRKIVERHGGSISAQSAPGQGATFIISLPLQAGG